MSAKDHIKARRKQIGLSQQDLADRMQALWPGADRRLVSKIERGQRTVWADEVPYLARALRCRPEELLDAVPTSPIPC